MAAAAPIAIGLAAVSKIKEGIDANSAARAQARVDDENARLGLLEGEQQVQQTRRDERMQTGEMLAAMGGSGLMLGTGSASDVLAQSAYQRELEVLNIRTHATRQASSLRQSADDKRAAGKAAIVNGVFGAAATALQGVSDMRASSRLAQANEASRVPRPSITGISR